MKITRDEARLLLEAIDTRCRVLNQFIQHPVLSSCIDKTDRDKICGVCEGYAKLTRKISAGDSALLRRELL